MFAEVKSIVKASGSNFAYDALGAVSLIVLLVGSLHLPTVF